MKPAAAFVHMVHQRLLGRIPNEYDTSYFLQRMLIGGDSPGDVIRHIQGSADEQFVREAYRRWKERDPDTDEAVRGVALVQARKDGRIRFLKSLGEPLALWEAVVGSPELTPEEVWALDAGEANLYGRYRLRHGRMPATQAHLHRDSFLARALQWLAQRV